MPVNQAIGRARNAKVLEGGLNLVGIEVEQALGIEHKGQQHGQVHPGVGQLDKVAHRPVSPDMGRRQPFGSHRHGRGLREVRDGGRRGCLVRPATGQRQHDRRQPQRPAESVCRHRAPGRILSIPVRVILIDWIGAAGIHSVSPQSTVHSPQSTRLRALRQGRQSGVQARLGGTRGRAPPAFRDAASRGRWVPSFWFRGLIRSD